MARIISDSTEVIFETECIGESLPKINTNFFNLDTGLEETSTALVNLSSKISGFVGLTTDNPGGIQLTFNNQNYTLQGIVRDSAINTTKLGGDIQTAGKNLVVRPQLSSLTDINLTNLQVGNTIKWDGTNWKNESDVGKVKLSELNDVYLPQSQINDRFILRFRRDVTSPSSPNGMWVADKDVGLENLSQLGDTTINESTLNNFVFLRWVDNTWKPDVGYTQGAGIKIDSNREIIHGPHIGDVTSSPVNPLILTIQPNSVTSSKLQSSATNNSQRAVTSNHIVDDAIQPRHITNNAIRDYHIYGPTNDSLDAQRAVTTNKIRNLNVTNAKLAGTAAGPDNERAVSTDKIRDNAINESKITNNAVTTNKIRNLNVTNAKLAGIAAGPDSERAVSREKIRDGAINADKIEDGTITVPKCGFQPITSILPGKNTLIETRRSFSDEGAELSNINGEQVTIHTLGHLQWIDTKTFSMTPAFYSSNSWMKSYGSWYNENVSLGDGTVIDVVRLKNDATRWQPRALISLTTIAPINNPAELSIYWFGNGSSSFPAYNFNRSTYSQVIKNGRPTNRYTWTYAPTSPGPYDNGWYHCNAVQFKNNRLWIGGRFRTLGALPSEVRTREGIAAINISDPNSEGQVTAIQPNPVLNNGEVHCIEHFSVGSTNYVAIGGSFNIRDGGRALVILNADSGQTVQWYTFGGEVRTLHIRNNFLYVGGIYTGAGRGNITNYNNLSPFIMMTRINVNTLNFDNDWSLNVSNQLRSNGWYNFAYSIKSTPERIWVGGYSAHYRRRRWRHGMFSAWDINTGNLIDFNEDLYFNSWVHRIEIDDPDGNNPILYAAGAFNAIYENGQHMYFRSSGRYYQYLAAVEGIRTNQPRFVRAWNPRPNSWVYGLDIDTGPNSQIYVGGIFSWILDSRRYNYRYNVAAISKAGVTDSVTVQDWAPNASGPVHDVKLFTIGNRKVVTVGGSFSYVNYAKRGSVQERRVDVAFLPPFPIPPDLPVVNAQTVTWRAGGTYAGQGGNIWMETEEVQEVTVPVQPAGNLNVTKIPLSVGSVSKGSLARFFVQRAGGTYTDDDIDVIGLSLDWDVIDDPEPTP